MIAKFTEALTLVVQPCAHVFCSVHVIAMEINKSASSVVAANMIRVPSRIILMHFILTALMPCTCNASMYTVLVGDCMSN